MFVVVVFVCVFGKPPLFDCLPLSPLSPFTYPLPPSKMFVGGLSWQTTEGEAKLLIPALKPFYLEEFD